MAGMIGSFLLQYPLGALGLGMLIAGLLSVVFYRWRNAGADLTPGMGARLGAASGIFGFLMLLIFTSISATSPEGRSQMRKLLVGVVEQAAARATDPKAQHAMDFFRTPQGRVAIMVLLMAFAFVAFLISSTLGGALGAALLRRKPRQ
jgi:hypothetical protein